MEPALPTVDISGLRGERSNMTIGQLQLLRNIGQFDNVGAGAQLAFTKLTLVYAENGRGKTTLAAVLRSAGNNEPQLVNERQRLGSANTPHIVIGRDAGAVMFQNGALAGNSRMRTAAIDARDGVGFFVIVACDGLH